jgi:hypothetical protein
MCLDLRELILATVSLCPLTHSERLLEGIAACMKNNVSPEKRIRKEEQLLDALRGQAKQAAYRVLHGQHGVATRNEWLEKLSRIKKERVDSRKRLAEAKDYATRLREKTNLDRLNKDITKKSSVVQNETESQAREQEALGGKDLHKLYQIHKRRTDGDGQEFIDESAYVRETSVTGSILARYVEARSTTPALSSSSFTASYPKEKTAGWGKRLDAEIIWQEVFLSLHGFGEKLRGHFKGCTPSCKLCSLTLNGLLEWSRIHTSRASGSDKTKPETLTYARPPSKGRSEAEYAEVLFEYKMRMSKALAKALHLCWKSLPTSCGFLLAAVSMIKKKTPPGSCFDATDSGSYRWISCGNTVANLLQSVLNVRLQHRLATEAVLTPFQFGFRRQLSTEHPQLVLRETIRMKTDEGRWVAVRLVDLSNAYDDFFLRLLFDILRRARAPAGASATYWKRGLEADRPLLKVAAAELSTATKVSLKDRPSLLLSGTSSSTWSFAGFKRRFPGSRSRGFLATAAMWKRGRLF